MDMMFGSEGDVLDLQSLVSSGEHAQVKRGVKPANADAETEARAKANAEMRLKARVAAEAALAEEKAKQAAVATEEKTKQQAKMAKGETDKADKA